MADVIPEQGRNTEDLRRNDEQIASFYRSVLKTEAKVQNQRGTMYPQTEFTMSLALKSLLEENRDTVNTNLTTDEIEKIGASLPALLEVIRDFASNNLRDGYVTSNIQYPVENPQPGEVCRLRSPHQIEKPPSAIVYLEDGKLKYRLGPKEKDGDIFDLSKISEGITVGEITDFNLGIASETANKIEKAFPGEISEEKEGKRVLPEQIGENMNIERDEVKKGESVLNWDEYDKSFDAQTDGYKAVGNLVFGYVDGNQKFYPANSKENAFDVLDKTGSVEMIAYNPKPIKINVQIKGFDKETGRPILGQDEDKPE